MKALNVIYLPKVSKANDYVGSQSEERNQNKLNENFRMISAEINSILTELGGITEEVLAQIPIPSRYVKSDSTDGIWNWNIWSDNAIDAFCKTVSTVANCTTASGSLYKAEIAVNLPTGIFTTVSSVLVTPICSANVVLATVKSVSASQIVVVVLTTASASVNVELCLHVFGV